MEIKNENVLDVTTEDIEKVSDKLYAKGGPLEDLAPLRDVQCYLEGNLPDDAAELFQSYYGRKPGGLDDRTWQGFKSGYTFNDKKIRTLKSLLAEAKRGLRVAHTNLKYKRQREDIIKALEESMSLIWEGTKDDKQVSSNRV